MIHIYTSEYFMKKALEEAKRAAEKNEVPIGAVVVCNNQIIARGHNQTEALIDVTAHAEMIALTAASSYLGSKYLTDCTLFVTVEPCLMCASALNWSRISKIVFGCHEPKSGYTQAGTTKLLNKTSIEGGVLETECRSLMQDFFIRKRNRRPDQSANRLN